MTTNPDRPPRSTRAFWLRQVRLWHWVSAAFCMTALLVFAATGIALNHADLAEGEPAAVTRELNLPSAQLGALAAGPQEGAAPLPPALSTWLEKTLSAPVEGAIAEWSPDEVRLSLPRPGLERLVSIDRATGALTYEATDRGPVGALNDLHTGRNAPRAWAFVTDVLAAGIVFFALTGLALLWLQARGRPATWPLIAAGVAAPLLAILLILHMA